MLLEACVDTGTPAVHACQTQFVSGESSMQRADTPEQPTKEDEAKARQRARNKAWRLANPEYSKAKSKAWKQKNSERDKAKDKARRLANPERFKARDKAYYAANPERVKARKKAWRLANPERWNAIRKASREKNRKRVKAYQKEYSKAWKQRKLGCVECRSWPDWREGLPHYDGHCFRCFSEKFPTHEKVKSKARVEMLVRAFISIQYSGMFVRGNGVIHRGQKPASRG